MNRREALKSALIAAAAVQTSGVKAATPLSTQRVRFGSGIEGQRKADLGDGTSSIPSCPATTPIPRS